MAPPLPPSKDKYAGNKANTDDRGKCGKSPDDPRSCLQQGLKLVPLGLSECLSPYTEHSAFQKSTLYFTFMTDLLTKTHPKKNFAFTKKGIK